MGRSLTYKVALIATAALTFSCAKKSDDETTASGKNLYIASGQCNSGIGVTTFGTLNSSRMISKVNLSSKASSVVFDLAAEYQGGFFAPETGAQSIIDNGQTLLMLAENQTNMGDRKIFSIPKVNPYNTVIYASDSNALTQVSNDITRSMVLNPDGTLLFSKTRSIEKLNTSGVRIPVGGGPYVNAPGGGCATSTTFMSGIATLPPFTGTSAGKIIFSHAGATAATNRLGIINQDGYLVAADCRNGVAVGSIPLVNDATLSGAVSMDVTTAANPTAMVYIPDSTATAPVIGRLLVAYSAPTNASTDMTNSSDFNHGIVMYDIAESSASAASIDNTASKPATILYRDSSIAFGISAMTYDSTDGSLYVATASQPGVANQLTQSYGYKIEKLTLNLAASGSPKLTLVRESNKPFIERNSFTRCISSMAIGD